MYFKLLGSTLTVLKQYLIMFITCYVMQNTNISKPAYEKLCHNPTIL